MAVAGLLAAHYPALRSRADARMGKALKAKLDPEDILQEVFLDALRRIDRFEDRGPDSFANWLLTILDSKLINAQRALHRRKRDIAREVSPPRPSASDSYWNLIEQLYVDSGTPSRAVRCDEVIGALMACMSSLSEPHRQVLQWRYLEGCSIAEVAKRLNRSEAGVTALTRSALKALREAMDRLGEFTRVS